MERNSPESGPNKVLGILAVSQVQSFLMDSLNLPNPIDYPDHKPFERWLKRWQRLLTFQRENENGERETRLIPREQLERFAPNIRTALRRIWHEKDTRQRDWYFYRLRDEYHRMIVRAENPDLLDIADVDAIKRLRELDRTSRARKDDPSQRMYFFERMAGADIYQDVPRVCPFEAAVYWLQVNHKLMVYCEGPVCAAPYFFRAEKGQKYCSPECANPARREAKLKWWNANRRG